MDYNKIYKSFIDSKVSLTRTKSDGIYYEIHHIIPRSLGGNNDKENLVLLTAKEHYFAHLLLVKCHTGVERRKMICALWFMCKTKKPEVNIKSSRQYEHARLLFSEIQKGKTLTDEHKKKIGNGNRGKKMFDEQKQKISEAKKGQSHSDEAKKKIGEFRKGKQRDEETRKKISDALTGKKKSAEDVKRIAEKRKGNGNYGAWNKGLTKETNESIRKNSEEKKKLTGEKSSQYGTRWVNLNQQNKKIKKEELNSFLEQGWKEGRIKN